MGRAERLQPVLQLADKHLKEAGRSAGRGAQTYSTGRKKIGGFRAVHARLQREL